MTAEPPVYLFVFLQPEELLLVDSDDDSKSGNRGLVCEELYKTLLTSGLISYLPIFNIAP